MVKQSLDETIEHANKEYGGPSEYYKLKNGANLIRILTPFKVYGKHFAKMGYKGICIGKDEGCKGCAEGTKPSAKWLAWGYVPEAVGDKFQNKLALLEFGYTIVSQLRDLQKDDEHGFEEFPMPYPINVKTDKVGTTDVTYTVIPRKESPIDEELLKELAKENTPEQIVEAMKEKKGKKSEVEPSEARGAGIEYPRDDINPDDIPF